MKLLVIEDDAALQELMVKALRQQGFVAESAMDFNEAIDRLGAYSYDCALIDINLPGGSGLDILEHIRKSSMKMDCLRKRKIP